MPHEERDERADLPLSCFRHGGRGDACEFHEGSPFCTRVRFPNNFVRNPFRFRDQSGLICCVILHQPFCSGSSAFGGRSI